MLRVQERYNLNHKAKVFQKLPLILLHQADLAQLPGHLQIISLRICFVQGTEEITKEQKYVPDLTGKFSKKSKTKKRS